MNWTIRSLIPKVLILNTNTKYLSFVTKHDPNNVCLKIFCVIFIEKKLFRIFDACSIYTSSTDNRSSAIIHNTCEKDY